MEVKHFFASVAVAAMSVASSASAATVLYSIVDATAGDRYCGTSRAETYDVAVKFVDKSLSGSKVVGIRVPMSTVDGLENPRAFITSELKIDRVDGVRQNVADWEYVDGSFDQNYIVATFTKPYTLTDEGIYVGFSFDVAELNSENMNPLYGKRQVKADGFWMHTTRSYIKWTDCSNDFGFTSGIMIEVEGEFNNNSAGISIEKDIYLQENEGFTVPVVFHNLGGEPIRTLEYSYRMGDVSGSGVKEFATPLEVQFSRDYDIELEIEKGIASGEYDLELTLDKINGMPNNNASKTTTHPIEVFRRLPVHRPLVEEYTGLWCGFCPRGYAMMEYMRRVHKENFVGIAYHCRSTSGDYIATLDPYQYPNPVTSFPKAVIDRIDLMDPYFGRKRENDDPNTELTGFNFEGFWQEYHDAFTPAAIDVKAWWDEDNERVVNGYATVTFCRPVDGDYSVEFILVQDGMIEDVAPGADPKWLQQNNFKGYGNYRELEDMVMFVEGEFLMANLTFNDVVLGSSRVDGFDGTLPGSQRDVDYRKLYKFDTDNYRSLMENAYMIQDRTKTRVVAVVVDKATGRAINAAQAYVTNENAVELIANDAREVATEYYDISGRRVTESAEGIVVKVVRYSDGTIRTSKHINK